MVNRIIAYCFLMFLLINSCNHETIKSDDRPVAKVFDKYLFESDIKGLFNEEISREDSLQIVMSYIDKWIRKQILLEKAELNLTPEQKDVEDQLEDYRSSLLIYKYEQEWIKQNLDTTVADDEIQEYYNLYSGNFILEDNIVKALYIKIPAIAPNIDKVKKWYKSDTKEDLDNLESYCYEFAKGYDNFNEEWISFNQIINQIPFDIADRENYLRRRKYIETNDSSYYYFINIREYKLKSEVAPLNFVKENIKQIIINKRKLQLINELETNIYNDALNYGHFKIFE
ncbi:MAG: peptidyl-prolyl cis-trans isomerase [Bacteroidales bacterium]|nr:peptidyl-prolyl cis-trans isomerase [Bacteroidales bacterium]